LAISYFLNGNLEGTVSGITSYRVTSFDGCICPPSANINYEEIPLTDFDGNWTTNIPDDEERTYLIHVEVPQNIQYAKVEMRGTSYIGMSDCFETIETYGEIGWVDNNTIQLNAENPSCESAIDLCGTSELEILLDPNYGSSPSFLFEADINQNSSFEFTPHITCPVYFGQAAPSISSIEFYGPATDCDELCEFTEPSHSISGAEMNASNLPSIFGRYLLKVNFGNVNLNPVINGDEIIDCEASVTMSYSLPICNYQYPALSDCEGCLPEFAPGPGEYVVSAWVKQEGSANNVVNYTAPFVEVSFSELPGTSFTFSPSGDIIDGWQLIEGEFVMTENSGTVQIALKSNSGNVLFDDIRFFPKDGSMKCFVYDPVAMRLVAELDERHFATLYEYDEEGALLRIKKETSRGIMTIQESRNSAVKK
jgi:hypothetical protein